MATWLFEFSDGGGPFTAVSTGQAGNAQNSSQPGLTYTGMSQLLPGHHYQFRITGKAADGTVLGSAVQPFSTPAQWPQVANLSVTVGTLEQLAVPPDNQTLKPARKVTWTYDPLPGGVAALATFDRISTDPVTNQTTTLRAPAAPTRLASGSFTPVEAGTRLHLCVAAIVNPYLPGELIGESCLDADVPGATGQTGSSTGLGGGSLPGAGGNPTRLPNQLPNPTKPTPMLNDGTPPTVTLSSIPAGMMISYSSVQGATNYSVCRESPPGASCAQIGSAGVAVLGNLISQVDLGLAPGSSHAYRVTATRADGHYGESAPVSGVAGPLDPPKNLRVVSSTSTAATLAWDPVTYTDYTGSKPVTAYQLTGTGISAPVTVNGPQASVSLTSGTTNYQWKVAATLANLAGQVQVSPTPAVLDYTPSSRYRLVALGVKALQQSKDDLLDMDGRADEIYVAAVVNTTTRGATGSNIGNARSTTYGDIGNANAFPGRVQAGTAGPYGGIRTGDIVPISLDLAGPTPAPNTLGFPFLLWEGTLDDNAMVVVHPAVWEDDGNKAPYGGWVSRVTQHITSGWAAYWTVVSALRDQEILGPQDAPPSVTCWDPLSGNAANPSTCIHYGRDRPIGLRQITYNDHYDDRVLVLTRSAVEKALAGPSPRAGTPAGSIIVPLFESGTRVTAMYELYLRLERAP